MSEATVTGGTAPVVERVICLHHAAMATDALAEKLPTWQAKIAESYPDAEPISDWKLAVPVHNGTPDFSQVRPELSLRHRFWGAGASGGRTWCIQCLSSAVVFNVLREKDVPHNYAELKGRAMGLLPEWIEHFEVRRFSGAEVRYVNRLNAELTPQFMATDGKLLIGKAFTLFTNIAMPNCSIVPPYDCTVTLQIVDNPKGKLTVRVVGETAQEVPGVAIHLACNVIPEDRDFDCTTVGNALDLAHRSVQDAFRRLFTRDALQSFGVQT